MLVGVFTCSNLLLLFGLNYFNVVFSAILNYSVILYAALSQWKSRFFLINIVTRVKCMAKILVSHTKNLQLQFHSWVYIF